MEYTPGPWVVTSLNGWGAVKPKDRNLAICQLVENNPANAVLIAEAPHLLETLEYFVKWAVTHNLHLAELTDGRIAEVPMVVIARKAIAKAKGTAA